METEELLEDVDDPSPIEEESEQNICFQVDTTGEEVLHLVDFDNEEFLKCSDGVVMLEDGSEWYRIPVAVGIKEEDVEGQVEVWENIEIQREDVNVLTESDVKQTITTEKNEVPVAAEVIVLDNGTIAYITQPSYPVLAGIEKDIEPKIIKKKNKSHYCTEPGCQRSYSSLHHLKVHIRNHTGDRPFKCSVDGCDKAFATDYSRKAHLRTHTGEKPYPCTRCNKSFKTSGDLQKHVRTHTGERPFICPVTGCNRSFTTSNIRKVHIRTHTGERPYTCKFNNCNRSFASSTNFKNHMRIHSGEKPFCCSVPNCEKRFTEYSSLYKHQLVHSQEKRYKCPFCYKMYRQMSTLTTHKRTIHGAIAAEDGTEIILEQMIGSGKDGLQNLKKTSINERIQIVEDL